MALLDFIKALPSTYIGKAIIIAVYTGCCIGISFCLQAVLKFIPEGNLSFLPVIGTGIGIAIFSPTIVFAILWLGIIAQDIIKFCYNDCSRDYRNLSNEYRRRRNGSPEEGENLL